MKNRIFMAPWVAVCFGVAWPAPDLRAEDAYVAATGIGTNAARYLKVARLTDVGGTPSLSQVQLDISGEFTSVNDVAFLRSGSADRLVAVLGNCVDFVPADYYDWYRWHSTTHKLRGKVVVYVVAGTGDLAVTGIRHANSFENIVTTSQATVSYQDRGAQHGETWRLSGLAYGGYVVNVSDVRDPGPGWQPDRYNPYNWLLVFDRSYALHFGAVIWTGWSDGGMIDVAGMANPYREEVAATWRGVAGGGNGVMRRYRIHWDSHTVSEEAALVGASGWIYYYNNVAPLAYVGAQPMLSGGVLARDGTNTGNVAGGFVSGNLVASQGWGMLGGVTGALESMGLAPASGTQMVVARCTGDNHRLFRLNPTTGTYADSGYSFTWTGDAWTVTASDGDAMHDSLIAPQLAMVPGQPNVSAQWNSASGQSYQVEATETLNPPDWQPYGTPLTGTDGLLSVSISVAGEPVRFFRLTTQRQ